MFLSREANIGLKNRLGETAIGLIPSEVMKEFLDECLESEGLPSDRNFRITFKYSFLGPPMSRYDHKCDVWVEKGYEPFSPI